MGFEGRGAADEATGHGEDASVRESKEESNAVPCVFLRSAPLLRQLKIFEGLELWHLKELVGFVMVKWCRHDASMS